MDKQKVLLTASELDEIYVAKGKPYTTADELFDVGRTIAQAQLAKAEPLIRADERKKIGEWLDSGVFELGIIKALKKGELPEQEGKG